MTNFGLKGHYKIEAIISTMFHQYHLQITGENLITLLGESFLMNRLTNNQFSPIKNICIGKGTILPTKNDTKLTYQTVTKIAKTNVNLTSKQIEFTADFTANEILNTSEIGLTNNDNVLITHDTYTPITNEILGELIAEVQITYYLSLETGAIRTEWNKKPDTNYTYYLREKNRVIGVYEENTGSGYKQQNNIENVETTTGSYYYDPSTQNLYIHTTNSNEPSLNKIIVQTK